jgi:hypothetical protein
MQASKTPKFSSRRFSLVSRSPVAIALEASRCNRRRTSEDFVKSIREWNNPVKGLRAWIKGE